MKSNFFRLICAILLQSSLHSVVSGKQFFVSSEKMFWHDGKKFCSENGGILAEIRSAEDLVDARKQLEKEPKWKDFWIGLSSHNSRTGTFIWDTDNSTPSFDVWPDGSTHEFFPGDGCAELENVDGVWTVNEQLCMLKNFVLCQKESLASPPVKMNVDLLQTGFYVDAKCFIIGQRSQSRIDSVQSCTTIITNLKGEKVLVTNDEPSRKGDEQYLTDGLSIKGPVAVNPKSDFCVSPKPLSWVDSVKYCEAECGVLAEIRDEDSSTAVNEFLKNEMKMKNFWIGLTDIRSEGQFTWESDHAPAKYFNWVVNKLHRFPGREDCVKLLYLQSSWKWDDVSCSQKNFALCSKIQQKSNSGKFEQQCDQMDLAIKLEVKIET